MLYVNATFCTNRGHSGRDEGVSGGWGPDTFSCVNRTLEEEKGNGFEGQPFIVQQNASPEWR